MKSIGKPWETHVAYTIKFILAFRQKHWQGCPALNFSENHIFTGKSGSKHELDIYCEFEKWGIKHYMAVECKNTKSRLKKKDVLEFYAKIQDINPDIEGMILSKNGFQKGAEKFAAHHHIQTLDQEDLPTFVVHNTIGS